MHTPQHMHNKQKTIIFGIKTVSMPSQQSMADIVNNCLECQTTNSMNKH